jgi:hypothetical protein
MVNKGIIVVEEKGCFKGRAQQPIFKDEFCKHR